MTRNLTLTLLGCLTLVACGTPQEQCISQNTREYRVVSNLLREVEALRLVELPEADQCCGFGGTFSVKNPDVSVAMGNDKARHVVETGAEYVVAGDNSCLAHIGGLLHRGRTGVKTIHLAEVLASTEQDPA